MIPLGETDSIRAITRMIVAIWNAKALVVGFSMCKGSKCSGGAP
jgi:hypothetical protein